NGRGIEWGARVQNLFTILKVGGLAALIVLAGTLHRGAAANFLPLWPEHYTAGLLTAAGAAMISTLFAYDGWHFVGFAAGEIRQPQRNVPFGIFLGVLIVIGVYTSANLAYIYVLGQQRIAGSSRVAADAMKALVGPAGATFITLAILCSTFGAINSNIL